MIHAIYSFVNVCYFLCRLIEYDIRYKKIYSLRYSELLIKTLISFRSIKNSKELTVNGKKFIKNLYSYAEKLKNKKYFSPNVELLNTIKKDYEIWIKKHKKHSLVCKYYTTDFFKKDLGISTCKNKYLKKVDTINDFNSIRLKSFKNKFKSINVPLLIEKQNLFKKNIKLTTVKNQLADYNFEFLKLDKHYGHVNTPKIKLDFKSFLVSKSKLYLGFINANEKRFVKSLIKDNKFINKFRLNNDEVLIFFNKPNSKISLHYDSGNNIHHTFFGHN